jgi:hypothetical protein
MCVGEGIDQGLPRQRLRVPGVVRLVLGEGIDQGLPRQGLRVPGVVLLGYVVI